MLDCLVPEHLWKAAVEQEGERHIHYGPVGALKKGVYLRCVQVILVVLVDLL